MIFLLQILSRVALSMKKVKSLFQLFSFFEGNKYCEARYQIKR